MNKAKFFRKMSDLKEIKGYTNNKDFQGDNSKYCIIKTVEMTKEDYKEFTENLLKDRKFIIETTKEADFTEDNGEVVLKCILVKEQGKKDGILVHSSGYDYARYTAIYKG